MFYLLASTSNSAGGGAISGMDMFTIGAVILGAALLSVIIFRKLGLGAVLGYLVGGMAIGPHGLGLINDGQLIVHFAEIGIVLLLFIVGLELAPSRLWRLRRDIFGLGLLQVSLCGLAMAAIIYGLSGSTLGAALALGLPLGLSSTAQVLPMLQSQGRLNTPMGERAFSILLFQDLSIIPLITILAALSRAPETGNEGPQGLMLLIYALVAIGGLILAGRYLLSPLLRLIGQISERELFIVTGLFAVFASAALMHSIGLSAALGAFIAGVMLADSPYRHELEADIDPFRSLLLGLFFMGVGMLLDIDVVLSEPLFIVLMAVVLVATKVSIIFGLAKIFGMDNRNALIMGLLLSQGGEFGFVLYGAAQNGLLITDIAASRWGAIITLSMASTPFLMLLGQRMGGVRRSDDADMEDTSYVQSSGAIVIGHGRFGQSVAQIFSGANIPVTLIDVSPEMISLSGEHGYKVYYGDGKRIDILRQAGADKARLLAFCSDDREFGREQVAAIAHAFPQAQILVRAYDRRHKLQLEGAGQIHSEREMFDGSVSLGYRGLLALDLDESIASRVVDEFRQRDRDRLKMQLEEDDMMAGKNRSFGHADSESFDPLAG